MISKKFKFLANQPYHPLSTLDLSLGNFRAGLWLICLVLVFSFFTLPAEAADCKLINVLTDKTRVGPGERMQVNITAQKECIGRTVAVKICDSARCADIASQMFDSRRVNGQEAINPVVIFIVPTNFINKNTSVFVQASGPFNILKSRPITIAVPAASAVPATTTTVNTRAQFGEFCRQTNQCLAGLICEGNACVECGDNNPCVGGGVCTDGACVLGDELPESGGNENAGSKEPKENALTGFPGEDLEANDVINIVIGLSCWLARAASVLAVIFVIFVGLKFMAAQGNQTKYGEAATSFKHVVWGVLVIYGAYVIIATVAHAVGVTNFSFIPLVC